MKTKIVVAVSIFGLLTMNSFCVQKKSEPSVLPKGHSVTITVSGEKALSYVYDQSQFKPYVKELYSPGGLNVLLDSPDDHKHHHGLMFAVKVDGINFWEEVEGSGRQEPQSTTKMSGTADENPPGPGLSSRILWVGPAEREPLLVENRSIKLERLPEENVRLITWTSEFSLPEGKTSAELGGNHYHGLGMRFIRSMDENGNFFTANNREGEIFRGEERLIPDDWCAYTAKAGADQEVTVAMFRSPKNPGDNTIWFTMKRPFAYLSATKGWYQNPFLLKAGENVTLTYGIAVWDGRMNPEDVARVYVSWKELL